MATPKKVTKSPATGVAAQTASAAPATGIDWGQYQENTGFDNVSQSDLGIPFLTIIQPKSAEVDRTNKDYPTKKIIGAGPGDIINTVSREVLMPYEKGSIIVVPAGYEKTWNEWKANRGGLVKVHRNPAIADEVVGKNEKGTPLLRNGNELMETACFYVLVLRDGEEPMQAVVNMVSTGLKHARHWLNMMMGLRVGPNRVQPPMFSHTYSLSVIIETKDNNSWYGWNVQIHEEVKDMDLVKIASGITKKVAMLAAPAATKSIAAPAADEEVPM